MGILAVLLLWGGRDYQPTAAELAVAPHRFDLISWEIGNVFDKGYRKLAGLLPWNGWPPREERIALTEEFFRLSEERRRLEGELIAAGAASPSGDGLRGRIAEIRERLRDLRPVVEETVESEISAVLESEGLESFIGVVFPPVDTVFSQSPALLVTSPRDRIFRLDNTLLRHGIGLEEREFLEMETLRLRDLSALVVNTGGIGSYPSVVSPDAGMHYAVTTAAHEWLHNWFFFRPLGWNFWDSPEMTTLNETAATLGGWEIGDRAYAAMTGIVVDRSPTASSATTAPGAFDFNDYMRETRQRAELLLSGGQISEAEVYMESRRQGLLERGYRIRKINQAYFAFYGSYATSAASDSPIEGQLRELRSRSGSLGEFLRTVAGFGSYDEFLRYLESGGGGGKGGNGVAVAAGVAIR